MEGSYTNTYLRKHVYVCTYVSLEFQWSLYWQSAPMIYSLKNEREKIG